MTDSPELDMVDVTIYYLEMDEIPPDLGPPLRAGLGIERVTSPTVAFYRPLYNAIGQDYRWLSRRRMSDEELGRLLGSPGVELHRFRVDGQTAGFIELDLRVAGEVEIVQFGLLPEFIGQGFGKAFLNWALAYAWSRQPRRVWLHTCSLDHPAALPNYLNAGFREYRREQVRREY